MSGALPLAETFCWFVCLAGSAQSVATEASREAVEEVLGIALDIAHPHMPKQAPASCKLCDIKLQHFR